MLSPSIYRVVGFVRSIYRETYFLLQFFGMVMDLLYQALPTYEKRRVKWVVSVLLVQAVPLRLVSVVPGSITTS